LSYFANEDDFSFFLPFLNSVHNRVRTGVIELLINLDIKRAFPLLFLRALLLKEVEWAIKNAGSSRQEIRNLLKRDINDSAREKLLRPLLDIAVEELTKKKEDVFSGCISEKDFNVVFDCLRLLTLVLSEEHFLVFWDSPSLPSIVFEKIRASNDELFVSLLKKIFGESGRWYSKDWKTPLYATEIIQTLRSIGNDESICYLLLPFMNPHQRRGKMLLYSYGDMPFKIEALLAFLENDMDELYRLVFTYYSEEEGIALLLTLFDNPEAPDYDEKVLRFLSHFSKDAIRRVLEKEENEHLAEDIENDLADLYGIQLYEDEGNEEEPDNASSHSRDWKDFLYF